MPVCSAVQNASITTADTDAEVQRHQKAPYGEPVTHLREMRAKGEDRH